jgi:hypothetical protein
VIGFIIEFVIVVRQRRRNHLAVVVAIQAEYQADQIHWHFITVADAIIEVDHCYP